MKMLCKTAYVLVIVGALNWGLIGLSMFINNDASWNLVNMLVGTWPTVEALVYVLVGVSAVYKLVCPCKKNC